MTDKDIKEEIVEEITNDTEVKNENICEQTSQEEIEKLKTEVEDWKNSYLRKQAEFQNFTKRKEKEFEDLKAFASEKIVVKVLDIIDNLERAITASAETKDFDSLVKGVELTLSQMKSTVTSEGVEAIETENATFDPHLHMAVAVEDSADFANDEIIAEFQKGYKMKGKVIRPSMVKVCKK
ncbi:nucleotide exchange factor GrpE [Candidatus Cetobacterium colombiensis]|jgi:molecular chaperone GrpE|uniref:Protein GrpE n=1 Tax=Candidatus Cetobacterium colombiensis TaxID=3073100 RepID=A0ABU4WBP9_9FUSO|nr:nucleotide exchange factor GrpE [Candidatus Cetobacterium colombiensis]MDX8336457.1 nucleotide exchange factor GrpE [Candidatus Cetobacterium colombiensis]